MRKTPVNGACITPDITPAIPNSVAFSTGKKGPNSYRFHRLPKRNPTKAPMNSDGANVPPHPPAPFVLAVAKAFVRITHPTYANSIMVPPPAKNVFVVSCCRLFASPLSRMLIDEYPSP